STAAGRGVCVERGSTTASESSSVSSSCWCRRDRICIRAPFGECGAVQARYHEENYLEYVVGTTSRKMRFDMCGGKVETDDGASTIIDVEPAPLGSMDPSENPLFRFAVGQETLLRLRAAAQHLPDADSLLSSAGSQDRDGEAAADPEETATPGDSTADKDKSNVDKNAALAADVGVGGTAVNPGPGNVGSGEDTEAAANPAGSFLQKSSSHTGNALFLVCVKMPYGAMRRQWEPIGTVHFRELVGSVEPIGTLHFRRSVEDAKDEKPEGSRDNPNETARKDSVAPTASSAPEPSKTETDAARSTDASALKDVPVSESHDGGEQNAVEIPREKFKVPLGKVVWKAKQDGRDVRVETSKHLVVDAAAASEDGAANAASTNGPAVSSESGRESTTSTDTGTGLPILARCPTDGAPCLTLRSNAAGVLRFVNRREGKSRGAAEEASRGALDRIYATIAAKQESTGASTTSSADEKPALITGASSSSSQPMSTLQEEVATLRGAVDSVREMVDGLVFAELSSENQVGTQATVSSSSETPASSGETGGDAIAPSTQDIASQQGISSSGDSQVEPIEAAPEAAAALRTPSDDKEGNTASEELEGSALNIATSSTTSSFQRTVPLRMRIGGEDPAQKDEKIVLGEGSDNRLAIIAPGGLEQELADAHTEFFRPPEGVKPEKAAETTEDENSGIALLVLSILVILVLLGLSSSYFRPTSDDDGVAVAAATEQESAQDGQQAAVTQAEDGVSQEMVSQEGASASDEITVADVSGEEQENSSATKLEQQRATEAKAPANKLRSGGESTEVRKTSASEMKRERSSSPVGSVKTFSVGSHVRLMNLPETSGARAFNNAVGTVIGAKNDLGEFKVRLENSTHNEMRIGPEFLSTIDNDAFVRAASKKAAAPAQSGKAPLDSVA
ncbi:unnamed protein product, partial [Amoebophrya sp. A25]